MVFTKEHAIVIKVLRQSKVTVPESCWRNFLTRSGLVQHWTDFCGRLTLQGLQTRSPATAENVWSAQVTSKCLCKWRRLWAQTVTDSIVNELLRRLFHIGNFCFLVPFLDSCCSKTVRWILLKFAKFAPERQWLKLLRGYLILIRFVVVIVISILASLFWNTAYNNLYSVPFRPVLAHASCVFDIAGLGEIGET